jgi:hypothetical protein
VPTLPVDADTHRRYRETGTSERFQLDADRKYFPIAPARWLRLKAIFYAADGIVACVCAIEPDLLKWARTNAASRCPGLVAVQLLGEVRMAGRVWVGR